MPIQCCLNGMHISEVPKFLSKSPSVTTNALPLTDSFDAAHLLIIPLQLSGVTNDFDVYSLSIGGYENEEMPKIHLIAEQSPWDPSKNKHSEERLIY